MKLLKKQLSKRKKTVNKTKKAPQTNNKGSLPVLHGKSHQYFLPQARLNLGQRRYCHCLMKSRNSMGQPYAFCTNIAKQDWTKAKSNKSKAKQYYFNTMKTNCVMNYDYDDYSLEEVQAFAQEKNIPLFSNTPDGAKKYYPKNRLVQLLVQHYLKKSKSQKRLVKAITK